MGDLVLNWHVGRVGENLAGDALTDGPVDGPDPPLQLGGRNALLPTAAEKTYQVVGEHDEHLVLVVHAGAQRGDVDGVAGEWLRGERPGLAGQEAHPVASVVLGQPGLEPLEELARSPPAVQAPILVDDGAGDLDDDRCPRVGLERDLDTE